MSKRKALGASALESVIAPTNTRTKRTVKPAKRAARTKPVNNTTPAKVRATFHLPADLLEEARDCVVALAGPPEHLTLASLAETALRREVERLKKKRNKGRAFAKRGSNLKGGRPLKRP